MFGIQLIDKPKGITSHDVVAHMRRRFKTRRIGHAGTLDPQATGLLVVAVGAATRFLQFLPLEPKVYIAEITFGEETTTQDGEGDVVARRPIPKNLQFEVDYHLPKFVGNIEQLPPMYSAVKKAGKPLYVYARKGEDIERSLRTIEIHNVDWSLLDERRIRVRLECSGGTYVRTWAHDLGQAIGCGAYLSGLQRTGVGKFQLSAASSLDDVQPSDLISLRDALSPPHLLVELSDSETAAIRQGQAIGMGRRSAQGPVVLVEPNGHVMAMARAEGNQLYPECVIPLEAIT